MNFPRKCPVGLPVASIKKSYRKCYIRNLDPGFPDVFLAFPYISLDFPDTFKTNPDPG